jgi:hypothetical protein
MFKADTVVRWQRENGFAGSGHGCRGRNAVGEGGPVFPSPSAPQNCKGAMTVNSREIKLLWLDRKIVKDFRFFSGFILPVLLNLVLLF